MNRIECFFKINFIVFSLLTHVLIFFLEVVACIHFSIGLFLLGYGFVLLIFHVP